MSKIEINECVYKIHPVYDLYAADENGNIINIIKKMPIKGVKNKLGYMSCAVRKHGQKGYKWYRVNRFIYECYNGIISEGKVIDHINNIKDDNRLCNLQLMTQKENCKKAVKYNDHYSKSRKNPKCVKATNVDTEKIICYKSMYAAQQYLGINSKQIYDCCNGIQKTSVSKKDDQRYKFEYVKKEDLPDDHIKSSDLRRNLSDDEKNKHQEEATKKWQNKEFNCSKCGKTYKNNYKYVHNKICKKKSD